MISKNIEYINHTIGMCKTYRDVLRFIMKHQHLRHSTISKKSLEKEPLQITFREQSWSNQNQIASVTHKVIYYKVIYNSSTFNIYLFEIFSTE